MKVVWLSHFIPFPPRGGSRQRSFNLIRHLASRHEVRLVMLNLLNEGSRALAEYKAEFEKFCAEVEIWATPYRWKGVRWWAELALSPLAGQYHAARALWSGPLSSRWRQILAKDRDSILHCDSTDLVCYFPATAGFRRVLNHHNFESAMAARRAANESHPLKKAYLLNQAAKISHAEKEWCPRFDVNLAVSELDAAKLKEACPGAHIHVVENGTDTDYFMPSDAPEEPQTLIFAGGLSWYPNVSGIQFFAREIWPRVRHQNPGVKLLLAGRAPAHSLIQWAARQPDITLVPDPVDIRPLIARAAVYICPMLDGGGTRLKILDALAMGKSVVSTAVGCEGLDVRHEEHVLIADTPGAFADAIKRLLADQNLRRQLGVQGRALVERVYSWKVISHHLLDAYECAARAGLCDRRR
jgi:glycosyltransferase involved in cell wall biosynthesis